MRCPVCGCLQSKADEKGRCPDCGNRLLVRSFEKDTSDPRKDISIVNIMITLLFAVFLVIGVCLVVTGIPATGEYYSQVKDRLVTVDARITRIYEWEDSDGNVDHDVFVTYTYQGKTYQDVEISTYSSWMLEGQTVTISIDPMDPGRQSTNPLFGVIGGVVVCVMGGLGLWFLSLKPWLEKRKK